MKNFLSGVIEGFYGVPWSNQSRNQLFQWMQELRMNTYMYAPKDDQKHRDQWRQSYSKNECDILQNLIENAKQHQVDFVYAISPGLDIVFTSQKDVGLLKEKLQQVYALGCRCFAILFDDIDPELCLADKLEYSSSADAQAALTNKLCEWFNNDLESILFCPTEYCTTRAKPDVESSEYLKTIGSKLDKKIKIFWTGPKVVPANIPCESLENLTKVLQRKPVIWDNIHANDYDDRRVYMGPYKGRSLGLYTATSGVLTNPNCEFNSNFIALESLALWYTAAEEHSRNNTESFDADDCLEELCMKWMKKLLEEHGADKTRRKQKKTETTNSLIEDDIEMVESEESLGVLSDQQKDNVLKGEKKDDKRKETKVLDHRDLQLICHFFYLPYECGEMATDLVKNFKWLKENAIDFSKRQTENKEEEWHMRAITFKKRCSDFVSIFERFCELPNQRIVNDLKVYIKEAQDIVNLLKKFVEFLGSKERERDGGMVPCDPEAWFFRGGLLGQLERLVPTSEDEARPCAQQINVIRPYLPSDKENVYKLCNDIDAIPTMFDHDDLPFDCTVGPWLDNEASSAFIMEVNDEICGFVAGHTNSKDYYQYYQNHWIHKMREKYTNNASTSTKKLTREEECIGRFYQTPFVPDDKFLADYPCVVTINVLQKFMDCDLTRRMVQCLMTSLKFNAHLVERTVKRKRRELLKDLGFTVHDHKNNDRSIFVYKI